MVVEQEEWKRKMLVRVDRRWWFFQRCGFSVIAKRRNRFPYNVIRPIQCQKPFQVGPKGPNPYRKKRKRWENGNETVE